MYLIFSCGQLTFSIVLNSSTRRLTIPGSCRIVSRGVFAPFDFQLSITSSSFSGFLNTRSLSFFTVIVSSKVTHRLQAFATQQSSSCSSLAAAVDSWAGLSFRTKTRRFSMPLQFCRSDEHG